MALWETVELPGGEPWAWTLGPLTLYLRRAGDEVLRAVHRADDPDAAADVQPLAPVEGDVPEDLDWARFVSAAEPCRLRIVPVMPDRPVVARPADAVTLPAGAAAVFFVSVPVWARIELANAKPVTLAEVPTAVLSNTWFGDPMAGDLCYSLRTRARRDTAGLHDRPHRAVCPVHVANRSPDPLLIERLCVHVAHLGVYTEEQMRLWTQRVNIVFRGKDRISDVNYSAAPPEVAGATSLLAPPREKHDGRSLLRRSLLSVREVFQL